jgi:cysteine desulfurase
LPFFREQFGNPHAVSHAYGWQAEAAMEKARQQVADVIKAQPKEIIFTSGATESNNLALKGVAQYYQGSKRHIITVETEHPCVKESVAALQKQGWEVSWLGVDNNGLIDLQALENAIKDETLIISIMAVNNEIGVIQPLEEIGAICHRHGVLFHSDAAQAFGKIPLNVAAQHIDLMSISGHKIYGPAGIGALYIRRRPRVGIVPLFSGGGQERGWRSGTVPLPLAVGLGQAAEIATATMEEESARLWKLHQRMLTLLKEALPNIRLNGHATQRIPGNLSIAFAGIEGDALLTSLRGVALSSGSACSTASVEPSYVLQALGLDKQQAKTTLRIGLGRFTTEAEVEEAARQIIEAVKSFQ